MYEDPRFESIEYFMWDMTNVEKLVKNKDLEFDKPAATDLGASFTNDNIRGALVAKEGPVYDNCNNYIKRSVELDNPWKLKLFTDSESAAKWLSTRKSHTDNCET